MLNYYLSGDGGRALTVAAPPLRPLSTANARSLEKLRASDGTANPPFLPAFEAIARSLEKLRFSLGRFFPPMAAISRRRSGDIDAKPRWEGFFGVSCIVAQW